MWNNSIFPTMKSIGADKSSQVDEKAAEYMKAEPIDFSKVKIEPLFEEEVDFDTFSKSEFVGMFRFLILNGRSNKCTSVEKLDHVFSTAIGFAELALRIKDYKAK